MTEHRLFELRDIVPSGISAMVGLFYGFIGVLCVSFFFEGFWIITLIFLPLLALQLGVIFGVDWLMKRHRAKLPPAPPVSWIRHHAASLGMVVGGSFAIISLLVNGPILGATT